MTTPGRRATRLLLRGGATVAASLLAASALSGPALAAGGGGPAAPPPQANPAATTATSMDAGGGPPPQPPAQPPAGQAQVPDALPAAPAPPNEPASPAPPAAAAPAVAPAAAPAAAAAPTGTQPVADTTAGERVVICKYVRKPHVAEVPSHIIIVNEQALVGRGFTGSFPWAFSDAHFYSLAIRWAANGEQARGVSLSSCPRSPVVEPPEPPGPGGTLPDITGSGSDFSRVATPGQRAAAPQRVAGQLPQTGAPGGLEALLLVSSAALLGGIALRIRGRRVRSVLG